MRETATASEASETRRQAQQLRAIAGRASSASRRGLDEIFDLGAGFEEAAGILKGSFGTWVTSECGFEPRTALGYRKAHRHLAERRQWLAENEVSPSVVVLIGSAPAEARERCLEAIGSGRQLTASQTRAIVREARGHVPVVAASELRLAARAGADALVEGILRLATMFEDDGRAGLARIEAAPAEAARLLPAAEALLRPTEEMPPRKRRAARTAPPPAHPVLRILDDLATARDWQVLERAGSALRAELGITARAAALSPSASSATASTASTVEDPSAIQSVHSGFRHELTAVEICAGGGGQAAGLARAGFRHLALVERSPEACRTLRAAFGDAHVAECDLVAFSPSPDELGTVDLLAGGVPCQPFSQFGRMKGRHDKRDLFPEALRLVETLRPRAVMLENVGGIFGPEFDFYRFEILARLERAGYTCQWRRDVDATHFGVAQRRIRAVLVGFREPEAMARFRWPLPVTPFEEGPATAFEALRWHLVARGYEPSEAIMRAMDRPAPTITGGSDRKQGIDFGMRKAGAKWAEMGFVRTRIGNAPPDADHEGPILATNAMLARLQDFSPDWPFKGGRLHVFRQIANAFPPAAALHLGCAIASALTGERQDPRQQEVYEAMRRTFRRQRRLRAYCTATAERTAASAAGSRGERAAGLVRLGRQDERRRNIDIDPPGRLDERPPAWQRPVEDWEIDTGEPPEELDVEATASSARDAGEADPGGQACMVS